MIVFALGACRASASGLATLEVCSPDGGSEVLVSASQDGSAFPEGARLEAGCASFSLEPGTWYVQVLETGCEGQWEEVQLRPGGTRFEPSEPPLCFG